MTKTSIPSVNGPELISTAKKYQDLSIAEIKKQLSTRQGRKFSTEQKILILKLLQYNGMNYAGTSKEAGVRRETLYKWVKIYGEFIFTVGPEYRKAQDLETSLATLRAITMRKAYNATDKALDKLNDLISLAMTPKDIHAVSEALRSAVEVIKVLLPETQQQDEIKPDSFFMNVHNMMIKNQYGEA